MTYSVPRLSPPPVAPAGQALLAGLCRGSEQSRTCMDIDTTAGLDLEAKGAVFLVTPPQHWAPKRARRGIVFPVQFRRYCAFSPSPPVPGPIPNKGRYRAPLVAFRPPFRHYGGAPWHSSLDHSTHDSFTQPMPPYIYIFVFPVSNLVRHDRLAKESPTIITSSQLPNTLA
jgi:hypothetical protein